MFVFFNHNDKILPWADIDHTAAGEDTAMVDELSLLPLLIFCCVLTHSDQLVGGRINIEDCGGSTGSKSNMALFPPALVLNVGNEQHCALKSHPI